jgi:hypothetical protein
MARGGARSWWDDQPQPDDTMDPPSDTVYAGAPPPATTNTGGGIPWEPGADHPSSSPPGYHWDPNLANFVKDAASTPQTVEELVDSWFAGDNPIGHQDKQYWIDKIKNGGGVANAEYWKGRFLEAPGAHQETPTTQTWNGDPNGYGPDTFGAPPVPYQSAPWTGGEFTPPPKPSVLQTPYEAPVWTGGDFVAPPKPTSLQSEYVAPQFTAPTAAELLNDPGYLSRLNAGNLALDRSAAARGSILSGGTLKARERYAQDYGSNEYGNMYGRALTTFGTNTAAGLAGRQQNQGEYNTDFSNAFNQYLTKYGQFSDAANRGLQARQQNQGEYQGDVTNATNQFGNRYGMYLNENARTLQDYLTQVSTRRNAEMDQWGRYRDLYQGGLQAALGTRT